MDSTDLLAFILPTPSLASANGKRKLKSSSFTARTPFRSQNQYVPFHRVKLRMQEQSTEAMSSSVAEVPQVSNEKDFPGVKTGENEILAYPEETDDEKKKEGEVVQLETTNSADLGEGPAVAEGAEALQVNTKENENLTHFSDASDEEEKKEEVAELETTNVADLEQALAVAEDTKGLDVKTEENESLAYSADISDEEEKKEEVAKLETTNAADLEQVPAVAEGTEGLDVKTKENESLTYSADTGDEVKKQEPAVQLEVTESTDSEEAAAVAESAEGREAEMGESETLTYTAGTGDEEKKKEAVVQLEASSSADLEQPSAVAEGVEGAESQQAAEGPMATEEAGTVEEVASEEAAEPRQRKGRKKWASRKRVTRPLSSIEVGQKLTGTVRRVMPYGAFIDVGAEKDGLLHVSRMASGFVKDASDICSFGDTLEVVVIQTDEKKGTFSLATVANAESRKSGGERAKALTTKWADFKYDEKEFVTGTIKHITDFGAFVDIGGPSDGLAHVSELPRDKPKDSLSPGDKVKVRVVSVDKKRSRISLSLKEYEPDSTEVSEQVQAAAAEQPVFKTSFQLAWEKANALQEENPNASKA